MGRRRVGVVPVECAIGNSYYGRAALGASHGVSAGWDSVQAISVILTVVISDQPLRIIAAESRHGVIRVRVVLEAAGAPQKAYVTAFLGAGRRTRSSCSLT